MPKSISKNAIVIKCGRINENPNLRFLLLQIKNGMKIQPGQFVALEPLNGGSMVVPFSVTNCYPDGKDTIISIDYKIVGDEHSSTRCYADLKEGEEITIIGPCGQGFRLPPKIKHGIFVAGGTGAAGLRRILVDALDSGKSAEFLLGVKNMNEIIGYSALDKYDNIIKPKIIKQTSAGGLVTDLLKKALKKRKPNTAVIACGPRAMLKAAYDLARKKDVPCFVSIEELVACGSGSCKGCAIKMADGSYRQLCEDGPVFEASLIDWEEFLPKPIIEIKTNKAPVKNPLETILQRKGGRKTELEYPWAVAPGCLGLKEAKKHPDLKVGYYHPKGVMLKERFGNPTPRICEAGPKSMINSIGLTGIGIDRSLTEELREWKKFGKPLFFQIAGETIEEYFKLAEKLANVPVYAVSINISCPNIKVRGGFSFGTDVKATYEIVSGVRKILPFVYLSVKLTPNVTDIVSIAEAAVKGGADCLEAINTLRGMRIDVKTRRPKIGRRIGGYSGAGIMPVGIAAVDQIYRADFGVPIKGIGGITCGNDVLEYLLAGASLIEVGTGWFPNKNIFDEITAEVLGYLEENKISSIKDIIGMVG